MFNLLRLLPRRAAFQPLYVFSRAQAGHLAEYSVKMRLIIKIHLMGHFCQRALLIIRQLTYCTLQTNLKAQLLWSVLAV